jgi:hypothetical protein
MIIIGCDYHPGVQQIAWVDTDTGELRNDSSRSRMDERERLPSGGLATRPWGQ